MSDIEHPTPIQDVEGYLGHIWDNEPFLSSELAPLEDFEWDEYRELIKGPRRLLPALAPRTELTVYPDTKLSDVLAELPSVAGIYDDGGPDAGPAAGSGIIYMLASGATMSQVEREVAALREALDDDLEAIRGEAGGTSDKP